MPNEQPDNHPPLDFRAAYIDPLNAATAPDELEIPTPAAVDITDLSQYSLQTLGEIIIELRVKIAKINNEKTAMIKTILQYSNLIFAAKQKMKFYLALINFISARIETPKSEEPQS